MQNCNVLPQNILCLVYNVTSNFTLFYVKEKADHLQSHTPIYDTTP